MVVLKCYFWELFVLTACAIGSLLIGFIYLLKQIIDLFGWTTLIHNNSEVITMYRTIIR